MIPYALVGVLAWLSAIATPPALGAFLWYHARKAHRGWLLDMLYLPTLLLVEWGLVQLIFFSAQDDGSGPPGLGLALLPAAAVMLGSIVLYYGAVFVTLIEGFLGRFRKDP